LTPPARKIIHIDMDAFFASVEQRDAPQYQGRPVVVGGRPEHRGVVAAASYEARAFGIRSAMPSHRAMALCPDLVFLAPRFDAYKAVSNQIRSIFYDYTDLVEPLSLDEAYLDVTVNKPGNPSASRLALEIKDRIWKETGLTASAGVSYNKFLAKVASDVKKPNGFFLITPEQAEAFLDALAIDTFYGIGKVTAARMQELGIHTGADLKRFSLEELSRQFGKAGAFYYRIVRGQDERVVEPHRIRKSVGAEQTFFEDLRNPAEMLSALEPLAKEVLSWLKKHQRCGRTITLKVKYANFQQVTRSRTLPEPLMELSRLMGLLANLLAGTEAEQRPVRLLGVCVSSLEVMPEGFVPQQLRLPLALG